MTYLYLVDLVYCLFTSAVSDQLCWSWFFIGLL